MLCVLMVASGADWEPTAFGRLTERPDVVVLKRCVDVDDLLATASASSKGCSRTKVRVWAYILSM